MKKTAREWFAELPQPTREKALANADEEILEKFKSLAEGILYGFNWEKSQEGPSFWYDVYAQYKGAPVSPNTHTGATIPTPIQILIPKIEAWAEARGITSPQSQLLKFFEEGGELASALLKNKKEEEKDAVGDVLVTLIIYCKLRNINLAECLSLVWEQIKNRTGKTQGGIFVKDETDTTTPIN